MMEQAEINVGATVVTADGQSAGKIIAVRSQDFIVEGGIFIKYICSYQRDDVIAITPTSVQLKLDTLALEQPWSVTEWRDPAGIVHHIRQVGVPMPGMTPPSDMAEDTQNSATL